MPSNLLFVTTVVLWLIFGLMFGDWPLILANVCATTAMQIIVAAKLRSG